MCGFFTFFKKASKSSNLQNEVRYTQTHTNTRIYTHARAHTHTHIHVLVGVFEYHYLHTTLKKACQVSNLQTNKVHMTRTHTHAHTRTHAHTHTQAHKHIYTPTHAHICVCITYSQEASEVSICR